jgi:uncharacterized Zn-finger protein
MESYPKFHNEVGVSIVRIGCHEFECIGDKPPQDHPHIYLNMAIPVRSCAPIALRYSVSIRAWAHTKLIRRIVLTLTWSENDGATLARFSAPPQLRSHQCQPKPHDALRLRRG